MNEQTIKERPIPFNDAMVRAILDGRKTMTRRVVKPEIGEEFKFDRVVADEALFVRALSNMDFYASRTCPYGKPGDRLWVKETWHPSIEESDQSCLYRSDFPTGSIDSTHDTLEPWGKWKSSRFMPRWASRILLEIVSIRVERLQDISGDDCVAEGVKWHEGYPIGFYKMDNEAARASIHRGKFRDLWESIYGPGSWEANPWVWVIEFKVVQP